MQNNTMFFPSFAPLVLVVDDHQPAAMMLKRLFENQSYEVHCIYNGEDALEWLQYNVPNLIILDVMMPGLSGFEVLEALRKNPRTADIPIILATAKDTPEDIEHGLMLGADDYVPKPIKPRELLARAKSKIEAYHLKQILKRRTNDLEALLRLGETLNTHLDIDQILELLLVLTVDLLPVQRSQVALFDDDHHLMLSKSSYDEAWSLDSLLQETIIVEGLYHWILDENLPYRYRVGCFLRHDENGYGILVIEGDSALDEEPVRVFEAIARQGAMTLRNALLYQTKIQYATHLEDMVQERTEALQKAQRQLVQSEKLASVGRLAAGIAHEINNPLTPIQLILEGMMEDIQYGDEIRIDDIQRILDSVIRIKGTVERLQQFTRMPHDDKIAMESVELSQVIDNVLGLTHKVLQHANMSVDLDVDPNLRVLGSRDQLEQVILNLVLNAKAAIGQSGIIRIRCWREQDMMWLSVQDNGVGIPEDFIDQIFEPFVTTKDDGSGLGLFVSYAIIQNHHGDLRVESKVGEGTTFYVVLPLHEE